MRLRTMDLIPPFGYPLGVDDFPAFIDRWRQIHHFAQAVVEVGKSWGEEAPDDSHSALVQTDFSGDAYVSLSADPKFFAGLRMGFPSVDVVERDADAYAEVVSIYPNGHNLERVSTRIRESAQRVLGPERQPARPAPDLPDHPVADGASFDFSSDEVTSHHVDAHYYNTQQLLLRFANTVQSIATDGEHELVPRLWPHHFDLASLLVVARDTDGNMTKTIGVGFTPPDAVEETGYWYVSPWVRDEPHKPFATPELPIGRWMSRGATSMAVLPTSSVWAIEDDSAGENIGVIQVVAIAEFVATAFNACMEFMDDA